MAGKHGIEQLKKVVSFAAEAGNTLEKVISGKRVLAVIQLADELAGLTTLNIAELKAEVSELDAADKAALVTAFRFKLDLGDDNVEAAVEEALELFAKGVTLAEELVAFAKKHAA